MESNGKISDNKVTFRPICERIKRFFPTAQTHTKPCRIIILIVQIKCPVKLYYAIFPTINNCMLNSIQLFIRRSRDSNPGWNRSHNDFRDRHLKPLGHFSNLLKLFKYYYFSITTLSSNWIFTLSPAFAL